MLPDGNVPFKAPPSAGATPSSGYKAPPVCVQQRQDQIRQGLGGPPPHPQQAYALDVSDVPYKAPPAKQTPQGVPPAGGGEGHIDDVQQKAPPGKPPAPTLTLPSGKKSPPELPPEHLRT